MQTKPTTQQCLIDNLQKLLSPKEVLIEDISKKSGISTRMIQYILKRERQATTETIEKLARAFKLSGWHLLMPDLHYELAKSGHLDELIKNYSFASQKGRETIDVVAETAPKKNAKTKANLETIDRTTQSNVTPIAPPNPATQTRTRGKHGSKKHKPKPKDGPKKPRS